MVKIYSLPIYLRLSRLQKQYTKSGTGKWNLCDFCLAHFLYRKWILLSYPLRPIPANWFVVLFPLQVLYIAILLSVVATSSVALLIGCGLGSFLIESKL